MRLRVFACLGVHLCMSMCEIVSAFEGVFACMPLYMRTFVCMFYFSYACECVCSSVFVCEIVRVCI